MLSVLHPSKDNVITDVRIKDVSKTGSNQGRSEILELFVLPEVSSSATYGKSRVLLQFDLTTFSSSVAAGTMPSASVQYKLRMENAPHAETLPQSFDLVVYPLSRSWDEGRGLGGFDEEMKDSGFSNWDDSTSTIAWSLTGSDFITTISASQHFDSGEENLELDVSNIVYAWLTGGLDNYGFVLKYFEAQETGSLELFTKKFFSRHAHVPERYPRLEALWTDFKQDDRNNVFYKVTSSLYLYRIINGFPQSAGGTVFVNIIDSGSNVVQTITSSLKETGIYEASGVFVTSSATTQIYRDVWFTDSEQLFTGNFSPTFATGSEAIDLSEIVVNVTNLKRIYTRDESIFLRVLARQRNYKPALRRSGSIEPTPTLLKEAFYEVSNDETGEILVPFSTGSVKFSKLSYDKYGNYFELDAGNFAPGGLYRIKILADYNNQRMVFDKDWIVKVNE